MTSDHLATSHRTHLCGALRTANAGQHVRLGGWVHRSRDLGGLAFVDLRDQGGIVQVSFDLRTPPAIPVARARNENLAAEELRLRHRFLDLRRTELQDNIILRHRLMQVTRRYFDRLGFLEIETPILTKPTPEGARDYLVPSRVHPREFYALPQSPQLYKQLLMMAGFDRYFQIARCFRDEDLRADRQPEFSQLDVETSFLDENGIMAIMEDMI